MTVFLGQVMTHKLRHIQPFSQNELKASTMSATGMANVSVVARPTMALRTGTCEKYQQLKKGRSSILGPCNRMLASKPHFIVSVESPQFSHPLM